MLGLARNPTTTMTDHFEIRRPSRPYGTPITRDHWRAVLTAPDDGDPVLPRDFVGEFLRGFVLAVPREREQATAAPFTLDHATSALLDAELESLGDQPRWHSLAQALVQLASRPGASFAALHTPFVLATDTALAFFDIDTHEGTVSAKLTVLQVVRVPVERNSAKFGRFESVAFRWTERMFFADRHYVKRGPNITRVSTNSSTTNYAILSALLLSAISLDFRAHAQPQAENLADDERLLNALRGGSSATFAVWPYVSALLARQLPPLTWIAADALARMHCDEYVAVFNETATLDDIPASMRIAGSVEDVRVMLKRKFVEQFNVVRKEGFLRVVQLAFVYRTGTIPPHLLGHYRSAIPEDDSDEFSDIDDVLMDVHTPESSPRRYKR